MKQIRTDYTSLFGDTHKHVLEKIIGGSQGKLKYPPRKCRACKRKNEMC
jgi:hypothetical protein